MNVDRRIVGPIVAILVGVVGVPVAWAAGEYRIARVKGRVSVLPASTPGAPAGTPTSRVLSNADVGDSIDAGMRVRIDAGGELYLDIVGALRGTPQQVLAPTRDYVTLPKPTTGRDQIAGVSMSEANRAANKLTAIGGRDKGASGSSSFAILAPAAGALVMPTDFGVAFSKGTVGTFVTVDLSAGGKTISTNAPAESGELKSERVVQFLRDVQHRTEVVVATITATFGREKQLTASFNVMPRADELLEQAFLKALDQLNEVDAALMRAAWLEERRLWLPAYREYQSLLASSPESRVFRIKSADLACLLEGPDAAERMLGTLAQSDRQGLMCTAKR